MLILRPVTVRRGARRAGVSGSGPRGLARRAGRGPPYRGGVIEIRDAQADDVPLLWRMLGYAAAWREGEPAPVAALRADPSLAHYVDGWSADVEIGVVALEDGVPVGAAWLRALDATDPGFGFVADDVPELSLAVDPAARGRGVGGQLLDALLTRARARRLPGVSLSVEDDNEAARWLYETRGFAGVGRVGASDTLALSFGPPRPPALDRGPHVVVGIVGTSHPHHDAHVAAIRAHPLADLGDVVPVPDPEPGDGLAAGFDGRTEARIAAAAMDSDVVVLGGGPADHLAVLRLVAGPGCAVFVEPPVAAAPGDVAAFVDLVGGAGIACVTGLRDDPPGGAPPGAGLSAFLDRITGRPHPPLADVIDVVERGDADELVDGEDPREAAR